ncbi:MAG TPA: AAA family ATPase [Candidatus Baltobacteraceae bacterium]|nr:AAA family ATPase [Candidatus Baltobacteraceae bacterium]
MTNGGIPADTLNSAALQRAALVVLAGGPCAGKTAIAHALVRVLPNAILLDKDFILGDWVDRLLLASQAGVDRDSTFYWKEVRPLEYRTLEAIAYDHLQMGKVVVLDAPLASELNDAGWAARIGRECATRGAGFLPVWVSVSAETAYRRMQARGAVRDHWKLTHWPEFLARRSYDHPTQAKLILSNEDGTTVDEQVARVRSALCTLDHQEASQ